LSVIVRLHARPGNTDAAERALEKITDPTRANPDRLEFRILQDLDDPRSFTLLERWGSLQANRAHAQRDYRATKDEIFETIDGEFAQEIQRLNV
jgi:quinol monooxygenase YgiN